MAVSVYELVTDRIIEQMKEGVIPWEKPWSGVANGAFNRISKRSYSLLNQMLLKHDNEYATYKQWKSLGGRIRKGERPEIVVFWKICSFNDKESQERSDEGHIKQVPLLRYIDVYNISQVDGVTPLVRIPRKYAEPMEEADRLIKGYLERENITLKHIECDRAWYSQTKDLIVLPLMQQFSGTAEYYSTLVHESVHSTMHQDRCNRVDDRKGKQALFGSEEYSKEELVAELGSASFLHMLNIETAKSFRNSTAYIQNWLSVLRNDTRFVVSAASKAEKAIKYILGDQATAMEQLIFE